MPLGARKRTRLNECAAKWSRASNSSSELRDLGLERCHALGELGRACGRGRLGGARHGRGRLGLVVGLGLFGGQQGGLLLRLA